MMVLIDAVALLLGYWVLTAVALLALLAMLGLARTAARAVAGRRARRQAVRAAVDAILVLADPRIHARAVGDVAWQLGGRARARSARSRRHVQEWTERRHATREPGSDFPSRAYGAEQCPQPPETRCRGRAAPRRPHPQNQPETAP